MAVKESFFEQRPGYIDMTVCMVGKECFPVNSAPGRNPGSGRSRVRKTDSGAAYTEPLTGISVRAVPAACVPADEVCALHQTANPALAAAYIHSAEQVPQSTETAASPELPASAYPAERKRYIPAFAASSVLSVYARFAELVQHIPGPAASPALPAYVRLAAWGLYNSAGAAMMAEQLSAAAPAGWEVPAMPDRNTHVAAVPATSARNMHVAAVPATSVRNVFVSASPSAFSFCVGGRWSFCRSPQRFSPV